ncbi:hypothetical protein [Nocardioides sp.]|uniref:hypothetical protein n=1 Tax=Nocardioides sp. TaxID=35761 RepID=UPI003D11B993
MGTGAKAALIGVVGLGVITAGAVALWTGVGPLADPPGCTATVDGLEVSLSTEQAENAALIAAIGVRRGLPARAVSIALATAYQESKITNLETGDRDSVGIFQQRPSQGWGTVKEILNPYYSINTFYDALEQIDGYEDMRITEAAQEVQRSGFPEAYQDHAEDARAVASALTGYSPSAFTCVVDEAASGGRKLNPAGLTKPAAAVRRDLEAAFGELPLGGFAPGGVTSGHMPGSAHYEGRALDVFVRPISADNTRLGWAIASYLVAQADRLDIDHVIFDDRIWTSGRRSESGWRDYDPGDTSGKSKDTIAILEHRDHVHVDVA